MIEDRFKLFASVHFLFVKDDKVLLLLRKNITSDGMYGLVAGHLEEGETITQAFVREAKEEVGVEVKAENVKISTVCHSCNRQNNREFIQFYAICDQWEGDFVNNEPEKCGGVEFFSVSELPENTVPYIRDAISKVFNGISYYEFGWDE